MGANRPWYWRVNVLKTIKMALVRPLMPDFKVAIKADGDVLHVAPPPTHSWNSPLKALTHWLAMECWLLGPSLPSPWLPASRKEKKSKISFPPTLPKYWLSSSEQPDSIPLLECQSPSHSEGSLKPHVLFDLSCCRALNIELDILEGSCKCLSSEVLTLSNLLES